MKLLDDCKEARIQGNKTASQIAEFERTGAPAAEIERLKQVLLKQRIKWLKLVLEVNKVLDNMPDGDELLVLRYRYILGKMWNEIMAKLGYSRVHINRIHKRALEELKQIEAETGTK